MYKDLIPYFVHRSPDGAHEAGEIYRVVVDNGISVWSTNGVSKARFDGKILSVENHSSAHDQHLNELLVLACVRLHHQDADVWSLKYQGGGVISCKPLPFLSRNGFTWVKPNGPVHPYPLQIDVINLKIENKLDPKPYGNRIVRTKSSDLVFVYSDICELYDMQMPKGLKEKVGRKLFKIRLDRSNGIG